MKVERKEKKVFTPITITLETDEELRFMQAISLICMHETLNECCVRLKEDVDRIGNLGAGLAKELNTFLDS